LAQDQIHLLERINLGHLVADCHFLIKLSEALHTMLTEFETTIQKESLKIVVPNGWVHPLTRYVMNYVSFLTNYSGTLAGIVAD
jgi:exocyst complex protein 7